MAHRTGGPDRRTNVRTIEGAKHYIEYQVASFDAAREIGELLAMSPGSIGPIRGRALERLARDAHVIALRERPRPAAALAAAGAAA